MGQIVNRQSLAFSQRGQISEAILQFHVERMLNEWTPIAWFESQHNERRVCEAVSTNFCVWEGDMTANERGWFESQR